VDYVSTDSKNVFGATYFCTDYRLLPQPSMRVGGAWLPFELTGQATAVTGQCTFGIVPNEALMLANGNISYTEGEPFWILGKNFMNNFYITFDYVDHQMKFAPRISSLKNNSFEGGRPKENAAESFLEVWIIGFVLVAALITASVIFWIKWSTNKNTVSVLWGTPTVKVEPMKKKAKKAKEETKEDANDDFNNESFVALNDSSLSKERVLVVLL